MTAGPRETTPRRPTVQPTPRTGGWSRPRTVAAAAGAATVLVALVVFATGHSSDPGTTAPAPVPAPAAVASGDPARMLARGDYAGAEAAYRERLRATPNDVGLRYGLGIAMSYLDRSGETAEQFQWIVANGAPGRREVADARHWLDAMGGTRGREARDDVVPARAAEAPTGAMKGVTEWPGVTPESRTKLDLKLVGDEPALEGKSLKLHVSLGGPYRFSGMPAGRYRLVGRTDTQELWNLRVVIEPGAELPLDLTPQNSAVTSAPAPGRPA